MSAPTARPVPERDAVPLYRRREIQIGVPAAALCALAGVFVASRAPPDERLSLALLEVLIIGVPMIAGSYALGSPHTRRFGVILILAGCAWSLTALSASSASVPYSVGRVVAWTVPLIVV